MSKKPKKAIWIADEYASIPTHIANRVPLAMLWAKPKLKKQKRKDVVAFYMNAYAEEKAKADAKLAELFAYTPDPERPVQFAMPRALEKAVVGPRELVEALEKVETLVTSTKQYFEVQDVGYENDIAGFEKMPDGTFHVAVIEDGGRISSMTMVPSQLAAFKQWLMEN